MVLCCVHLAAQSVLIMNQSVSSGNNVAQTEYRQILARVPIPLRWMLLGLLWLLVCLCVNEEAKSLGFGRYKLHPWVFSWFPVISLAIHYPSVPHDT